MIDDSIWKAGPEAVARAIEYVKAALIAKRLPVAEALVADPETGKFSVVARPTANAGLLSTSLSQVADAVDDVLADQGNGLREDAADIRVLRRVIGQYGNDPQRVEMDMEQVSGSLLRQMAIGDLPESASTVTLQDVVKQTARGIRAAHPEIAANREILRAQSRKELSQADRKVIADAAPVISAISQEVLQDQMHEDVLALTDDMRIGAPPLLGVTREGGDALVRAANRWARMLIAISTTPELIKKLEGSTAHAGATIVLTLEALVRLVFQAF